MEFNNKSDIGYLQFYNGSLLNGKSICENETIFNLLCESSDICRVKYINFYHTLCNGFIPEIGLFFKSINIISEINEILAKEILIAYTNSSNSQLLFDIINIENNFFLVSMNDSQKQQAKEYFNYFFNFIGDFFKEAIFVTNNINSLISATPATFSNLLLLFGYQFYYTYDCYINCEAFEILDSKIYQVNTGKYNEEEVNFYY